MGSPPGAPPDQPPREGIPLPEGATFAQERTLIGSRSVTFATRGLNPPSMLYVTADDGLYVAVANVQAGQSITLAAHFLLPDGRLQPNVWTVNPPATGALTTYLFTLAEGYLFNITVQPIPNTRRGVTWIYCAVRRGSLASGNNLQTLLQDYVDSFGGPTWPGGQLRNSTDGTGLMVTFSAGSGPSTGANYIFTVPTYARVRMRSVVGQFNTGAAVANRLPAIFWYSGGYTCYIDGMVNAQVASKQIWYSWTFGLGWAQDPGNAFSVTRGLPDMILNPGDTFQLGAWGQQAGDQWLGIILVYEQWFSI